MSDVFDRIPGRNPRLLSWAAGFRKAGWSLKTVADLFDIEPSVLREAGIKP